MSHKCFKSDITLDSIVHVSWLWHLCFCLFVCVWQPVIYSSNSPGRSPYYYFAYLFLFVIYTIVCTANAHEWLTIGQLQFRVIVHWLTISIEHCPPIIIYNHFYHFPAIQRNSNSYTGFIDSIDRYLVLEFWAFINLLPIFHFRKWDKNNPLISSRYFLKTIERFM